MQLVVQKKHIADITFFPYLCALSKLPIVKKYFRKKAMSKLNTIFSKDSLLPRSMLIFFDSSSPENEKIVTQWLRTHKDVFSQTMIIGIDSKNADPKATIFPIIGKKDLTWFDMLKQDVVQRIMPDFIPDFLMVLHKKPLYAIDALVLAIPANLKISHRPILKNAYNIILDRDGADWHLLLHEFDSLMPKVTQLSV